MEEDRVERLDNLLLRAKRHLRYCAASNLTFNEISSLVTIYHGQRNKGTLTMSEAGELLELCRSATSQLVARLERKGMLKRELVLWDRRKTLVRLTEKVEKTVKDLEDSRIKEIRRAIDILGEDAIDQFSSLFEQYMDAVEGDNA